MSLFNPPKSVDEYVGRNSSLVETYRKAGYSKYIDEQSNKLATNIYNLVKSHADDIEKYSEIYQKILKAIGAEAKEDIHKQYDFEDQLKKHQTDDSKAVLFINSFFENLDKLESYYKAKWNPLPDNMKQEVVEDISSLKEFFFEGYDLQDKAWELKDHMNFIFDPLNLEENFGNKKEEFESVVNTILFFQEWRRKERKERSSDENFVREELLKAAKLYTESLWMHTPVITVDLLISILGTYTIPLNDAKDEIYYIERKLPIPIIITLGIAYFYPSVTILFGLLMLFILYLHYQVWKTEKKFKKIDKVYSEISTEGYDGEEIGRRLHRMEEGAIDIPSIVYPLLKLKHKPSRL